MSALLRRAAERLRDPYRCNNDPAVDSALAELLEAQARYIDIAYDENAANDLDETTVAALAVARAVLRKET